MNIHAANADNHKTLDIFVANVASNFADIVMRIREEDNDFFSGTVAVRAPLLNGLIFPGANLQSQPNVLAQGATEFTLTYQ